MSKLSYLARVMSGVRLKKMNQMIDIVHDKCGQNKVKTFFDMCWCGARYGAGYYDYVMFGFYNMNGHQRDTYLTRVRNKKVIDHMNDLSYSDEFDDKLRFNQRFAKYLGRKNSQRRDGHAGRVHGLHRRSGGHFCQNQPRRLRPGREQAVCEGL